MLLTFIDNDFHWLTAQSADRLTGTFTEWREGARGERRRREEGEEGKEGGGKEEEEVGKEEEEGEEERQQNEDEDKEEERQISHQMGFCMTSNKGLSSH